jgi:hypothetical protein
MRFADLRYCPRVNHDVIHVVIDLRHAGSIIVLFAHTELLRSQICLTAYGLTLSTQSLKQAGKNDSTLLQTSWNN